MATRVPVAQHPAHAVSQVDHLLPARARLDGTDGGGQVLEQVAVDVPIPVEIPRKRAPFLSAQLDLQLAGAPAMPAQLDDVAVGAPDEQPLDEGRAGERVPV